MTVPGITSTLAKTPAATAPGAPPGVAPTLPIFDDLLLPALPADRHDLAVPGKKLPADDAATPADTVATILPFRADICPQPVTPKIEPPVALETTPAGPTPLLHYQNAAAPTTPAITTADETPTPTAGTTAAVSPVPAQQLDVADPRRSPPAPRPGVPVVVDIPGARPVLRRAVSATGEQLSATAPTLPVARVRPTDTPAVVLDIAVGTTLRSNRAAPATASALTPDRQRVELRLPGQGLGGEPARLATVAPPIDVTPIRMSSPTLPATPLLTQTLVITRPPVLAPQAPATLDLPPAGPRTPEHVTVAPTAQPAPATAPAIVAPRPVALSAPGVLPALPAPGTAGHVFAEAIHRALSETDRQPGQPGIPAATAIDLAPHAVVATVDARHAALDMQRETWPTRMIERIETLRDTANANDTSIRLIPNALGTIDVSLKREGERVHVHFTAAQAETRQLLADTRTQLADLAAARGLTLSLGGGDGADGRQPRQQPAFVPATPPRATADNDDHPSDQRIA